METNKIELLKRQYGEIHEITVLDRDGSDIKCYLKEPGRDDLRPVLAVLGHDSIRANEILLASCWIEGDERIKTDDYLFFQASPLLAGLIQNKLGTIKKL